MVLVHTEWSWVCVCVWCEWVLFISKHFIYQLFLKRAPSLWMAPYSFELSLMSTWFCLSHCMEIKVSFLNLNGWGAAQLHWSWLAKKWVPVEIELLLWWEQCIRGTMHRLCVFYRHALSAACVRPACWVDTSDLACICCLHRPSVLSEHKWPVLYCISSMAWRVWPNACIAYRDYLIKSAK